MPISFKSTLLYPGFGFAHGGVIGSRLLLPCSTELRGRPLHRDTGLQFVKTSRPMTIQCKRGSSFRNRQRGDGRRPSRVGELIRREISPIIDDAFARAFTLEDGDSPVLVSVVDVKCSDDLRNARVSVSVLGTDEQRVQALRWLRGARKELRFELAQCVRLKHIPELSFDESEMAAAVKTMNILNRLAKEREEKMGPVGQKAKSGSESTDDHIASFGRDQKSQYESAGKDSMITDDLGEFEGYIDEDDDAEDVVIIDVAGDDEDEGGMVFNPDEELKR